MKMDCNFPDESAAIDFLQTRGWSWLRKIPNGTIWTHPRVFSHNCWLHTAKDYEGNDAWHFDAVSHC